MTVEVRGDVAAHDVSVLQLAASKGLFADVVEDQVTYVNAPLLASERGVEIDAGDGTGTVRTTANLVTVRGALPDGRTVSGVGHR